MLDPLLICVHGFQIPWVSKYGRIFEEEQEGK